MAKKFVIIIEIIAIRNPAIEKSISFLPRHLEKSFVKIPIPYRSHTIPVPISLGSRNENSGKADGSQITPITIANVSNTNPITAE